MSVPGHDKVSSMQHRAPITRAEIFRQPEALVSLSERHDELRRLLDATASTDRIYAFGCGDGLFAAQGAAATFAYHGLPHYSGSSSLEFLQCYVRCAAADCLLVPISMSGNVDRTVEGLLRGLESGSKALPITNSTTGLLAQTSQHAFHLALPEPREFLAGTVTYTASVLTLALLAIESAEIAGLARRDGALRALAEMIRSIGNTLSDVEAQVATIVPTLTPATRIYFLGGGSGFASARYAASKFVELTGTHAIPQDTEEFAHSNFWHFRPSDVVFVLHEPADVDSVSTRSAALLRDFGAKVVEVAYGDPTQRDPHVIRIGDPYLPWSQLALSIPIQLLAYYWSLEDGLDPDSRAHLKEDELRFRVSRMLSRSSLVHESGTP